MNQKDLNELLTDERFSPFVITTFDGFAIAIGQEERKHLLAAARMVVIMDAVGDLIHIPYRSIAHIQEAKQAQEGETE
jgi:hypothetical protein